MFKSSFFLFYIFIIVFQLLLFIGCERDFSGLKPISHPIPQPPNDSTESYLLYVGNWGSNEIFVVDTDSNKIVDTLKVWDTDVWHLAITKDGKKLFICTRKGPVNSPGKIFSIDLETKSVSMILEKAGDVFMAPDGTVIIVTYAAYSTQGNIGTIDPVSDAVTFFDTLDIRDTGYNYQGIVFDRNRPLMYGVTNENLIFSYDYYTRNVAKIYHNSFNPNHMALAPDGNVLYCTAMGDFLVEFDLQRDSILTVNRANQLGSLSLSPDGEYLYITDPGRYMIPEPVPSGTVSIFQTSTNSYIGYIDVNEASGQAYTITDRSVLMPDGKNIYVSNWIDNVFVIDIDMREVIQIINIYPSFPVPMVLGVKQ